MRKMGGKRGKTKKGTYKKRINRKRANRRRTNRKQTGGTDIDINDRGKDLSYQQIVGISEPPTKHLIHIINMHGRQKEIGLDISKIFNRRESNGYIHNGCVWAENGELLGKLGRLEMEYVPTWAAGGENVLSMFFWKEITETEAASLRQNMVSIDEFFVNDNRGNTVKKTIYYKRGNSILLSKELKLKYHYVYGDEANLQTTIIEFSDEPPPTQDRSRLPVYREGTGMLDGPPPGG
jgi:hypothetical protein